MTKLARNLKLSSCPLAPDLSDASGQVMLSSEYRALSYNTAVINVAQLLIRPGIARLKNMSSMAELWPWDGTAVLSSIPPATLNAKYKQGAFHFRSPIDGSRLQYGLADVISLAQRMGVDHCVLAKEFFNADSQASLLASIQDDDCGYLLEQTLAPSSLIPTDLQQQLSGAVFAFDPKQNDFEHFYHALAEQRKHNEQNSLLMTCGDYSLEQGQALIGAGVDIIDSPKLFSCAMQGLLFSDQGVVNILDDCYRGDFRPIDDGCDCHVCQQYTRAYFYHLFAATPLLSIRLQMWHNLYFISR